MAAARIAGVTLPPNKRIVISLMYIFGVGRSLSEKVLKEAGISEEIRAKDLTDAQVNDIRKLVEKTGPLEGELRRTILSNIKRLKEINCYRGVRHMKHLPVRGQRTKPN